MPGQPPSVNSEIKYFASGTQNLLDDTLIPSDAAKDSKNWLTQDGRIKLVGGRINVGPEGASGMITGEIFGYRADGSQVHWRKADTNIDYSLDGIHWITTITGLTANADYAFSNYSSLAGAFTFFFGADGIFKANNANPGSYIALYDSTKNFKGRAFINKGRSILWNYQNNLTGIYGSHIDPQDGTYYQTAAGEIRGSGDGTTKTFTGTLNFKTGTPTANSFGLLWNIQVGTLLAITAITQSAQANITVSGTHGLAIGDKIVIEGVVGMTQINGAFATVIGVPTASTFLINIDTTSYTPYVSGGTVSKGEEFKDNYLGGFTDSNGNLIAGSIDYATGIYSITFPDAPSNGSDLEVSYQWENSNNKGVTDFTHSATRLAGEGFFFPQELGGDAILNVLIGQDGAYYSAKSNSFYRLLIGDDDLTANNNVFYDQLGIQSWRGAISIQIGIVFMNTSNPEKPELTILQRNPIGGNVEPRILFPQFKFSNYDYSDACFETVERYLVLSCTSQESTFNDVMLLCDIQNNTVDITYYQARTMAKDNAGNLYIGSPVAMSIYKVYDGFDDMKLAIDNFWTGKGEMYQPGSAGQSKARRFFPALLKKHRRLRYKGLISPSQSYEVYVSYDDAGFQLIGTVLGTGDYVDNDSPTAIGGSLIGGQTIGGGMPPVAFPYFVELRIKKPPKFMKRTVMIVAIGIGYVDISYQNDFGLLFFEDKLPNRFRQKQNVSTDGTQNNLPNPQF